MSIAARALVLCAGVTVMASPSARAQNAWQFGTAPSFSSGRYGTDTRTEILHTPFTARRLFDAGDLTVVIPHLCIRGNGGVTIVGGSPVRKEVEANSRPLATGQTTGTTTRPATGATAGRATSTATTAATTLRPGTGALATTVTNCGMGDLIVRGRVYVVDERGWVPTIAVRAHVKAATADADRGLGTGKPDEGIGVEVSRTLGRGALVMGDAGYTMVGKPAGADFANTWWYDVGFGQDMARGVVNLSVFFEEYSAVVPGLVPARDLLATLSLKSAGGWRVQVSGQFGLSDGAPDHGVTFGASRRF